MRKVISLSALVSGLLASPVLAAGAETPGEERIGIVIPAEAQGAAMVDLQKLQAKMEAGPADVGGMRALHRRMVEQAQGQLAELLAEGPEAPPVIVSSKDPGVVKMEKAAFLGITTSPATATLREQLGLAQGFGLVVDFVEKDSPADQAGLKVHDVMTKLDDQLLVNAPQLTVLVRSKKAGDTVTLTVIRAAKPVELKAKLVERDVPVLGESGGPPGTIETFPGVFMRPNEWNFVLPNGNVSASDDGSAGEGAAWQKGTQVRVVANGDGSTTTRLTDAKGVISLKKDKDGTTTILAKDSAGNVAYSGPYTTEEDKKKVPAEIAARVQNLQTGDGVFVENGTVVVKSGGFSLEANQLSITRNDEHDDMTLTINGNGNKSVVVKDAKTGKETYNGPANTPEDFKNMPPNVAEKVKALAEKVNGK